MQITAIVSWPDSFDFPVFRSRFPQLFQHVDKLVVGFTKQGNMPIRDWLRDNCKQEQIVWVDTEASDYPGDWRNKSTKMMLDRVETPWTLSIEQDFLIREYDDFFYRVKTSRRVNDIVMFQEYAGDTQRFHPAFLLCKTDLLKQNTLDFSVMGDGMDHFAKATKMLKNNKYTSLETLGLLRGEDWYHMAGLTENYFAPKPYYRLSDFYAYNEACKTIEPMSSYWREQMKRCSGEVDRTSFVWRFL